MMCSCTSTPPSATTTTIILPHLLLSHHHHHFHPKAALGNLKNTCFHVHLLSSPTTTTCRYKPITTLLHSSRAKKPTRPGKEEEELVGAARKMLSSMGDGDISVSAYDTAWVSMVESSDRRGIRRQPQFPSCLHWIAENQLADGSWGDGIVFVAHDRILCTLACVIALMKWSFRPHQSQKGMDFIRENMGMLEKEKEEHIPIGFEVLFPSLLQTASKMKVELPIPHDLPFLQHMYATRLQKFNRIPREVMHSVPTTLLHSLEGMEGMEWEKLLELKCEDGSFLFSPSSTAYAVMETGHPSCLRYLHQTVKRFNGGVPNVYPVDMFQRAWAVDRVRRLGICRHFKEEVKESVEYVRRNWTSEGICWARRSRVNDIDDTAMGFRLLRLHGYDVSADAFRNFKRGGEFFCFEGQSNQAVTGMFNLYRAAQLGFNGETIMEEAMVFASTFLSEKLRNNQVVDKWVIAKDLKGEIKYALEVPWLGSLPRVETRLYLEQYGGDDDVWIGKTLYRMPVVNNNTFLELAKLDYNKCNQIHLQEWKSIREWYGERELERKGVSMRGMEVGYFVAMASMFEPEKATQRLAWAKTAALLKMITSHFKHSTLLQISAFYNRFITARNRVSHYYETDMGEMEIVDTLCHELVDLSYCREGIRSRLFEMWRLWLKSWVDFPDAEHGEAGLLVSVINLCNDASTLQMVDALLLHPLYHQMMALVDRICTRLLCEQKNHENSGCILNNSPFVYHGLDYDVKKLMEMVLSSSSEMDYETRGTFLTVVKAYYYTACLPPKVVDHHISLVLFQTI